MHLLIFDLFWSIVNVLSHMYKTKIPGQEEDDNGIATDICADDIDIDDDTGPLGKLRQTWRPLVVLVSRDTLCLR